VRGPEFWAAEKKGSEETYDEMKNALPGKDPRCIDEHAELTVTGTAEQEGSNRLRGLKFVCEQGRDGRSQPIKALRHSAVPIAARVEFETHTSGSDLGLCDGREEG
jgi:hypothetical protein